MLGFSRSSFMVVWVVMFGSPYSAANAETARHTATHRVPTAAKNFFIGFLTSVYLPGLSGPAAL